ncbi:MAG: hypothetical protein LBV45_02095 [Xanthomonadaceae bacterium]|jgi:hypothetical protein|nr:hypothetical protein [Xanthomonadaceae bacterium]
MKARYSRRRSDGSIEYFESWQEMLASGAAMRDTSLECAKMACKKETEAKYAALIQAHDLLVGGLYIYYTHIRQKRRSQAMIAEELLSAAFITGISECMRSTVEGMYVQAMTLIRQEVETLAHIEKTSSEDYPELLKKHISEPNRKFVKNVKNMKNLRVGSLREKYDYFSKIAHSADIDALGNIFGEIVAKADGQSDKVIHHIPIFRTDIAKLCLSCHMLSVIHFCCLKREKDDSLVESSDPLFGIHDSMVKAIEHALSALVEAGCVEIESGG